MLIAYDGGAFQPGASAGLLNCTVGLLNAAGEVDPSVEFVLVADPRGGDLDPAAVARLTRPPEIVYAPVAAAFDPQPRGLLTDRPDIRFIVDDVPVLHVVGSRHVAQPDLRTLDHFRDVCDPKGSAGLGF